MPIIFLIRFVEATGLLSQYLWSYHSSGRNQDDAVNNLSTVIKSEVMQHHHLHQHHGGPTISNYYQLPDSMVYLNEEMMQLFYQCALQSKGTNALCNQTISHIR